MNQALVSALTGQAVVINAGGAELLANADAVAEAISSVMHRRGITMAQQWRVTNAVHKAGLAAEVLDALASPDARTREAAAKLCGALRLAEAVPWLSDLLADDDEKVRGAAARALGQTGGRRAVDALVASAERFPAIRLAVDVAHAASDIDLDGLLRSERRPQAAAVVAIACGLRADALRFPRLVAIARDPANEPLARAAACRALGMIGDRAAAGVLRNLSADPNEDVSAAAAHALRRYHPGLSRRA